MSGPYVANDARILSGSTAFAQTQKITATITAQPVEVYTNDSAWPTYSGPGNRSVTWEMERVFYDLTYCGYLIAGSPLGTIRVRPGGSTTGYPELTLYSAYISEITVSAVNGNTCVVESMKGRAWSAATSVQT